jgi:hypothetical protein
VLVEAAQALELGGADDRPQVIAGAGLVDHLDVGPRQRRLDQRLDLRQIGHRRPRSEA